MFRPIYSANTCQREGHMRSTWSITILLPQTVLDQTVDVLCYAEVAGPLDHRHSNEILEECFASAVPINRLLAIAANLH